MQLSIPLIAAFTAVSLVACQADVALTPQPTASPEVSPLPDSMKGYELYSWLEANQWYYSLLPGTNREKAWSEIAAPTGADGMTAQTDATVIRTWFTRLGKGATVTWRGQGAVGVDKDAGSRLEYPPVEVQSLIQGYAADAGVTLQMDMR